MLSDSEVLSDCGIYDGATVHLVIQSAHHVCKELAVLGSIECIRCMLLRSMIAASICHVGNCLVNICQMVPQCGCYCITVVCSHLFNLRVQEQS